MYEQLGRTNDPSIMTKVILAFLVPLVVFIGSLMAFERIFSGVISAGQSQSALSFASALLVTFGCILVTEVIGRKVGQDK